MPQPHPLSVENPPKISVSHFMGIYREKQRDAVGAIRQAAIQAPEPRNLAQRAGRHGREKQESNCGVWEEPTKRGRDGGAIENPIKQPVFGRQAAALAQPDQRTPMLIQCRGAFFLKFCGVDNANTGLFGIQADLSRIMQDR